jgi:hypothetical protein
MAGSRKKLGKPILYYTIYLVWWSVVALYAIYVCMYVYGWMDVYVCMDGWMDGWVYMCICMDGWIGG